MVFITDLDMLILLCLGIMVIIGFSALYKMLFFMVLNEQNAQLAGVPVGVVNVLFATLTAITVSMASRMVGALIVSTLMVLPVACAMQMARSYRQMVGLAVLCALSFVIIGLCWAFYVPNMKPGGIIALISVFCFVVILLYTKKRR
jgi:zinc transport system permease protein